MKMETDRKGWVLCLPDVNHSSRDIDLGQQHFFYDELYASSPTMDILNYEPVHRRRLCCLRRADADFIRSSFELVLGVRNDD